MKIFLIAEIGINHNGNLTIAKKLIDSASEAGFDAVKFQKRTIEKVFSKDFLNSFRESPWGNIQRDQKLGLEFNREEYQQIDRYCKENNIEVVDGTKIKDTKVNTLCLPEFIEALKIPMEVRDYQKEAFIHAIKKKRCLLLSPTASGKSLIVYLLVRFNLLRLKDKKILIIVPTTSLVEQLYKDFKDYGWDNEKNIHRIYEGHSKDTDKKVIISTWQ